MIKNLVIKAHIKAKTALSNNRGAIGKEEIIGIAVTMIVAAFVVIPQFRNFATNVMDGLGDWWTDTISPKIFPDS
jgi:hypothetical protein